MMNSQNGKMIMQHHQTIMLGDNIVMMKMMKDNPALMQNMMSAMMETANGDTTMMSGMIRTMMGNQQMMEMMQNMNTLMED